MDLIRCYICMELKHPDEYYNKIKICKKCRIAMNSERVLCECGRYYARAHRTKHIKTKLHANSLRCLLKKIVI